MRLIAIRRKGRSALEARELAIPSLSILVSLSEFPSESLTVSNGELFCLACREELSLKKCVLSAHIQSAKHKSGKKRLTEKEKQEMDIAEALRASDSDLHPKGETLPQDQRVYRVKVV